MKPLSSFQHLLLITAAVLLLSLCSFILFSNYMSFLQADTVYDQLSVIVLQTDRICQNANGDEPQFLANCRTLLGSAGKLGSAVVLDGNLQVVFPDDPVFLEARKALIGDFALLIREGTLTNSRSWKAPSGGRYAVRTVALPETGLPARFCVAFSDVGNLNRDLGQQVKMLLFPLLLFSVIALIRPILFFRNTRSSLRGFCSEAERIGTGDLSPLVVEAPLREAEELRSSLNRSLKVLQEAGWEMNTIFSAFAHRMQNLLSNIEGCAQGIEAGVFTPAEAAGRILKESRRMEELQSNFTLYTAMIEHRTHSMWETILSAAEAAQANLERYLPDAEEKGVSLSLQAGDGDAVVTASEKLLESVLGNLLSNAIRHARTAVVLSVGKEAGRVFFRVEDDGGGIPDSALPHIFEPLFKGAGGGLGLGLTVAARAAELMGGTLTAENRPEGGAAFTLRFPEGVKTPSAE